MGALEDALAPYRCEPPLTAHVHPSRVGRYRGLGEILDAIAALRRRGGRVEIAARSHEGIPVLRVELGARHAPRGSLLVAGLHAMEWIGVETALGLLEKVAAAPGERRLIAFPLLNPDGYRRAEADLRKGRLFRFVRANARGVDLNRNWPTHWRTTRLLPRLLPFLGSAGTGPGSEPEVCAVLEAIKEASSTGTRLERALSLHSFGSMLLLPYGGRWKRPAAWEHLYENARKVQAALPSRYGIKASGRWVPGFFAHGMELDHLLEAGMEPLLVECSRGGFSIVDPGSWLCPFRWFNPPDPERHVEQLCAALLPFLGYGPAQ